MLLFHFDQNASTANFLDRCSVECWQLQLRSLCFNTTLLDLRRNQIFLTNWSVNNARFYSKSNCRLLFTSQVLGA